MIVCHCTGASDRAIRHAVRNGASTVADVAERCAAGSCCGGCHPTIERIIRRHHAANAPQPAQPVVAAAAR